MRGLIVSLLVLVGAAAAGTVYLNNTDDAPVVIAATDMAGSDADDDGGLSFKQDSHGSAGQTAGTAPVDTNSATEAAAAAVRATASMVTGGYFTRRDVISAMSTQRYGPELIEQTSVPLANFSFEVDTSDEFWLIVEPIRTNTTPITPDQVRVDVWALIVVASTESGVGRETWQTVTLDMQIEEGRWLVDSWLSEPGPTPAPSGDLVFSTPAALGAVMSWPVAPSTVASNTSPGD